MVAKSGVVLKFPNSLRFFAIAIVLSGLMVWSIEQIVVARGFLSFQESLNRHAAHLADGKEKAVVLGSMIMMGGVDPIIRATAQGSLKPDNPNVMNLLMRLHQSFGLGNIRIVDATGKVVAYFTKSGKSATGEVRSSRPYFIASMKGNPSMYPALGHTSGARGVYIAAPIFEKDAAINVSSLGFRSKPTVESVPKIIGAVVAKLGFEEVDSFLKQESDSLAVVSPEGVVFASNVPAWQFRVLGNQKDIELVKNEQRVNEAFEKESPRLLNVDDRGWLLEEGHSLKMASASIDWKDPHGTWRLVGFADPLKSFGNLQRISVGAICFVFIMLLGGWWQARNRVAERTAELVVAHEIVHSSIQYASHIQRAILPLHDYIEAIIPEHFILWEPRDIVGGDMYWCKPWGDGSLIILGDCTGHGVPGAFMTLLSNGALERAIGDVSPGDAGGLVQRIHRILQNTLKQDSEQGHSDDGIEMGVCYLNADKSRMFFAGARFDLYILENGAVKITKGSKSGMGYRGIPHDQQFASQEIITSKNMVFYLVSDGIVDQIGADTGWSVGRKRLIQWIVEAGHLPLADQKNHIYKNLLAYQGNAKRRDDVSVIGFRV